MKKKIDSCKNFDIGRLSCREITLLMRNTRTNAYGVILIFRSLCDKNKKSHTEEAMISK